MPFLQILHVLRFGCAVSIFKVYIFALSRIGFNIQDVHQLQDRAFQYTDDSCNLDSSVQGQYPYHR